MNFFEGQFRKMLWGSDIILSPFYVDGVCFGTLGRDHLIQMEFIASRDEFQFDELEIVVVNRAGSRQKTFNIRLKDVLEDKAICHTLIKAGTPYLWFDVGTNDHVSYEPTWEDWGRLQDAVKDCLDSLCKPEEPQPVPAPTLVYICAPLRGDVERNIEFARQRARDVFQAGEVPICPHLMFPPIADPGNPSEDQAARDIGLRLVALCQQVNVYGGICTPGMQAEIDLARKLGIPVSFMEGDVGYEEK